MKCTDQTYQKFCKWIEEEKNVSPVWKPDIQTIKLWEEFLNRPSSEEIRLRIIDCLYGGMEVADLEKWLKDNLITED